jgi:hypothetical protein
MGAGASAVAKAKGADSAAITAGVQALGYKDKGTLKLALEASLGGDSKSIADNVKANAQNDALIHECSLVVMTNKQGIFEARSMMEENRGKILQNYQAAVTGNRNMAMENTDAIFKNRTAILDSLKVNGAAEENFRASKKNESAAAYLENQCLLDNRIAKANDKMAEANAQLIAVNDMILAANEEMQKFNEAQTKTNKNLLEGILEEKATPEANAARIASNKEKVSQIKERNDVYKSEMGSLHANIKESRKKIEANSGEIKERRKAILANRKTIDENGLKVAKLLENDCFADLASALDSLSDDEKANIKAALSAPPTEESAQNKTNIKKNEASLHELSLIVFTNKSKLLANRSIIEENRAMLFKNYTCAFGGNRLMLNQNTDCIFKNRKQILKNLKCEGQVKKNFRNSKFDEARVDFLEHRSLLNNRIADTNAAMEAANAKLIEANAIIMKSNEETVTFNSGAIDTNLKLLEGLQADKATPESNAKRIAANTEVIKVIKDHNTKYDEKVDAATKISLENRKKIIANAKAIDERRKQILDNRGGIIENGQVIVKQILS